MITKTIAEIFRNIAKILEIKGANIFRIRAYERAAVNIESLSQDIQDIINDDRLKEIPGIGDDLSEKIIEIVETGKLKYLEELKKTIPEGLLDLLTIPSVGPKHAKLFYDKLGIKSVPELEKAAKSGKLITLETIKEKTAENILKGIAIVKDGRQRMNLATAISLASEFIEQLKKIPQVRKISPAGSLRRMKEAVRDIDLLVVSSNPGKVMEAFVKLPWVKNVLAQGNTKASITTTDNFQVDLRVVRDKSYGAALLYFTGSKNFNVKLRQIAIKKNLKVNEYGVFSVRQNKESYISGKSEEQIFKELGLSFIEPELREDTGEIELSAQGKLPKLITIKDIKGDFHAHSKYSDGNSNIEEMVKEACSLGYEYINIADHSQSLKVARGLTEPEVRKKKKEIGRLNAKAKNFKILFGAEVDIDKDGNLDYPENILREFDIVVAAIHSGFKQSSRQLTKRIVSACKNKNVDIIAHPTGKLWGVRDAYEIDLDEIFRAAYDNNTALEINAHPWRLDLDSLNCRRAKEKGLKFAIGTDAHITGQLKMMHLGLAVARRGWLGKEDVLNALSCEDILRLFKKLNPTD